MFSPHHIAVVAARALLLFAGVCSTPGYRRMGPGRVRQLREAAGLSVLSSPIAPGKVRRCASCSLPRNSSKGELSLVAPDGKVAIASRERHGGPPYFWSLRGYLCRCWNLAGQARAGRAAGECSVIVRNVAVRKTRPAGPGVFGKERLAAAAQYLKEQRHREPLPGLGRDAVRRAARSIAVMAGAARRAARSLAQSSVQSPWPQGGQREEASHFVPTAPTCLPPCAPGPTFKMGLPCRYSKCTRGRRRPGARVYAVVEYPERGTHRQPPPQQVADGGELL